MNDSLDTIDYEKLDAFTQIIVTAIEKNVESSVELTN